MVGAIRRRSGLIRPKTLRRQNLGLRRWLCARRRQLLQPPGGSEELASVDVRVARDRREVGVAEVLGDEARIAELLPEPGRSCVSKRMGGHVLL